MKPPRRLALASAAGLCACLALALSLRPVVWPTEPTDAARPLAARVQDPDFDSFWGDGRAEVCGYRYRLSRYGEERRGEAVAIFVTEPFSESQRVKVEEPSRNPRDAFTAFKLNLVRDFQTGIYDYDTMISCFLRAEDFAPLKVTFTSSEWCGNVYEEIHVQPRRVELEVRSYFEGESSSHKLEKPRGGILEDQLFVLLRGLRGPLLEPGETRTFPLLESPFVRRLEHRSARWTEATLEREPDRIPLEVPAGSFEALRYTVRVGERQGRFDIERSYPHRVLAWRWEVAGELQEEARLAGSERLRYWELQGEGDESQRARVGLGPSEPAGPR